MVCVGYYVVACCLYNCVLHADCTLYAARCSTRAATAVWFACRAQVERTEPFTCVYGGVASHGEPLGSCGAVSTRRSRTIAHSTGAVQSIAQQAYSHGGDTEAVVVVQPQCQRVHLPLRELLLMLPAQYSQPCAVLAALRSTPQQHSRSQSTVARESRSRVPPTMALHSKAWTNGPDCEAATALRCSDSRLALCFAVPVKVERVAEPPVLSAPNSAERAVRPLRHPADRAPRPVACARRTCCGHAVGLQDAALWPHTGLRRRQPIAHS